MDIPEKRIGRQMNIDEFIEKVSKSERLRKFADRYLYPLALFSYFGIFLFIFLGFGMYWKYMIQPAAQPIAFSHRIHASQVGLPCDYCHMYADKGRQPGIPSVQKCMSCHENVATEKPQIKVLKSYWDNKEPIPWVRVHNLPDHVYFSHKRHIKKNIDCTECHGQVKMMETIRQVRSLKMGWCIRCHEANEAPIDCYICHK